MINAILHDIYISVHIMQFALSDMAHTILISFALK